MTRRRVPLVLTDHDAPGQLTEPETLIFVAEFHVFAAVSIHGPTACAPPTPPNWVWHEST